MSLPRYRLPCLLGTVGTVAEAAGERSAAHAELESRRDSVFLAKGRDFCGPLRALPDQSPQLTIVIEMSCFCRWPRRLLSELVRIALCYWQQAPRCDHQEISRPESESRQSLAMANLVEGQQQRHCMAGPVRFQASGFCPAVTRSVLGDRGRCVRLLNFH
ncbi:hypothetical protein BS50DRAFT_95936 [Corynespora cassiicola Philippines]|uniref:Uncharacterized protein n=1 Tax=Corynespora cassiicola Philippines TaxID=1448308 RepID=A0A2T2NF07_CORCC|nr:hypothetical protein BS50DRAFT_95936 [Corynespora cassiicola Philippines]